VVVGGFLNGSGNGMKKLTNKKRQKQLETIATISDEKIDTSDIPELTDEQLRRAVGGQFYRPIKKPVTMRLDADVIEWLKQDGPGYQTKANSLLRREMIRSYREKKQPGRASSTEGSKAKKSRTQ
jgi:uncharacterized protein (DUF4415 family)